MDEVEKNALEERSKALRTELKIWEKDFQNQNEGRKASREDIKKNPDIASKYKEYDKVRNTLSGKIALPPPKATPRKKRKYEEHPKQTPQKRLQLDKTPSKNAILPWDVDPYHSPSIMRNLFATPQKKTAIGPTPQKDGQVLGLFDLEEDSVTESPSMAAGTGKASLVQVTPRKPHSPEDLRTLLHSRTPSSKQKSLFNAFITPSKNRTLDVHGSKTPSSISKLHFNTPSFLRRDSQRFNMPAIDENAEGPQSPDMIRVPKKPLIRGLSSMLAGLRKMEDDAADDDLDALREMENEQENGPRPIPKPKPQSQPQSKASTTSSKPAPPPSKPTAPPNNPTSTETSILAKDTLSNFPLGAFDDEALYDTEPEDAAPFQPTRKAYRKKGQKRTTRRVNLKPNRSKPVKVTEFAPLHEASSDEDELAQSHSLIPDFIPETQLAQYPLEEEEKDLDPNSARNFDSDSQSEYTASEGGTRTKRPPKPNETTTEPDTFPPDGRNFDSDSQSEYTASEGGTRYRRPNQNKNTKVNKEGRVKTAARKVKATANQNFKRLKLRNTGAKGGPGVGSRFRRRK